MATWKRKTNSTPNPKLNSTTNPLRNLEKANLGGVIFACTDKNIDECLSKQLFGLPAQHLGYVKNIDPGLPLFLFNHSRRELHGVYEAASPGQLNINPYGWTRDGSERTPYPAQVLICTRKNCRPLVENQFSPVIKGNYYTDKNFHFELDHVQANKLTALFLAQVGAPSPVKISSIANPRIQNLRPPKMQKGESDGIMSSSALIVSSSCHEETLQYLSNDIGANGRNEVEVMYEKLQQLSVNSKPSDSNPVTQVHESSNTDVVNFDGGESQEKQISEKNNVKDSSLLPPDYPSIIAQLMLEVQELKAFKEVAIDKMERLEHKLLLLEPTQLPQGHDDRTSVSLPGNTETFTPGMAESCSDQLLDSDDFIFLAGGYDGTSSLASLECYCPSKDIIKSLCPMSSSRSYTSLARLNGDIYVIGGGPGGDDGFWYDSVERYNPMHNEWTSLPCLSEKKGSLAAVTLHDKIFAVGGGNGVKSFSDVEMFDLDLGRWISARSMLQKRFAVSAVELNGALYAVGGFDERDYLSSVERFDPREHSWSKLGSMNSKRGCHATVVLNEKLYAVGGFDGISMVNSVEMFDPRLGTWIMDAPMKYQRGYGTVAVLNNNIYAIGGLEVGQNIIDKIERYEEGQGWEVTDLKAIGRRCFASAIV